MPLAIGNRYASGNFIENIMIHQPIDFIGRFLMLVNDLLCSCVGIFIGATRKKNHFCYAIRQMGTHNLTFSVFHCLSYILPLQIYNIWKWKEFTQKTTYCFQFKFTGFGITFANDSQFQKTIHTFSNTFDWFLGAVQNELIRVIFFLIYQKKKKKQTVDGIQQISHEWKQWELTRAINAEFRCCRSWIKCR